jgi:hypothetical protein
MPFYMISEEEKKKYVGIEYESGGSKHKVVDVGIMLNSQRKPCFFYDVVNSADGSHELCDATKATYLITLVKVEKPDNSDVKFGEIKTITDSLAKHSYADNYIDIVIFGVPKGFSLVLTNKSGYSIKLNWDDAVFVDYEGAVSKIIHKGIKYSEKDSFQPPSVILRDTFLDERVVPTCYVENIKNKWDVRSMYSDIQINETKQVRLMLPIQIKEITNEYVFVFEIKKVYAYPELLQALQKSGQ